MTCIGEPEMQFDRNFKKAKMSQYGDGNAIHCVEVKRSESDVQVRDSKSKNGPVLTFTHGEWLAFLDGSKSGEFDL